ncbi:PRD domain-containing protein [Clostridium paraputrificum]|uniref:Regulatory protein LuxO n=3 Tax=Clostridium TaxID=1485 RepID=A0A6N3E975_9CLOT|nr:sigma-54-dependent transcriptional regulator [Clostridium sp.]MBS5987373.1 sigma 54-interacting transcriptional regulator [Clostridium sp.]
MGRKDNIYNELKNLDNGQGVTTITIANSLGLCRANVSSDLNKLCQEGKVTKKVGKPTVFMVSNKKYNADSILDLFASKNKSLYNAVEQAKAAILYPPNGMNMLILGETGVGKSMFASLIHSYALEVKRFSSDAPFIIFNCADYASNPQLLISQLFGCKKGAYTGADTDKIGLIEKAHGGILFLDEVHRLPPEGQEMLFTFMDKGIFRRLGETEVEREAEVLIIAATTEDPNTTLLKTFTRRIPMTIHIPNIKDRTIEERYNLISTFMREESGRLNEKIKLSVNSIKALLVYECTNNVGQLRADIQLICAKVYASFISGKKKEMSINSLDLPEHIRKGLYEDIEHRQLWSKFIEINKKYYIFDKSEDEIIFEDYKDDNSIYEKINIKYHELKSKGMNEEIIQDAMKNEVKEYFKKIENTFDSSKLESFINKEIIKVIKEIIEYSERNLDRKFSDKVYYGMAVHINSSIERVRSNKKITNPQLNKIRTENEEEFNISLDCLRIIEKALDIRMPIDEAGFLAMFFSYDNKVEINKDKEVKIIVVAHGAETATSMADAANSLLGSKYAIGINAPINEKPEEVLRRIRRFIRDRKISSDILLLVDMGSLTTFGGEIESEFNIRVKIFPLVSTLHVIEATRKAILGCSLDEILLETLRVNELYKEDIVDISDNIIKDNKNNKKLAILCICTTGEGGAQSIKGLLNDNLNYDKNLIDILTLNLVDSKSIEDRIRNLKDNYDLLAIISSFEVNIKVPQFDLQDIFIENGISRIQKIIDIETTYIKMNDTLRMHLKKIDGDKVLRDIKEFNNNIQESLNERIETNRLIGITLHIACMLDKAQSNIESEEFIDKDKFIKGNEKLYCIVKRECETLEEKYETHINTNEICYIMSFFKGTFKER